MVEMWVFFVGVMAGVTGVTLGFGLLFAWLIIRGERNERRRERENQRQLLDQRRELESEYGQEIRQLQNDMVTLKAEHAREISNMQDKNDELQARVSALTEVLVKVQRHIGINISAGDDVNIGEFVGADKHTAQQTTVTTK